jgi:hypothetical protein
MYDPAMQNELTELRKQLAIEEAHLAKRTGMVHYSPAGPTSMELAKAIIGALEAQAREIESLKAGWPAGPAHP